MYKLTRWSVRLARFVFLMILTLLIFQSGSNISYADTYGDYTFRLDNNAAVITGYSGLGGSISIPDTMDGHRVSEIDNNAFQGCDGLTSVAIPASVTRIGYSAFLDCTDLTSVSIPSDSRLTSIDSGAFMNTSLTSITIPDSVISIGGGAFGGCSDLQSIYVSSMNPAYSNVDGILYDKLGTTLIWYPPNKTGPHIIPNGVTRIGFSAFWGCNGLTSIIIPDGVTSIGDFAFWGCSRLASVYIPDSVTNIESHTFQGCSSLTVINIPDGVTSIIDYTFMDCTGLRSVTIPASVTHLGNNVFNGCSSLSTVKFLGDPPVFSIDTFQGCSSNLQIYFPDGVTGYETLTLVYTTMPVTYYSVNYDGNGNTGGSVPSDSNGYMQGESATVLRNTRHLVKAGFTLDGWNTAADGRGTDYAPNATLTIGTASITLYAKWTATVTFDSQGGTSVPSITNVISGSMISAPTQPTRTGHTFSGWYKEPGCTNPWNFTSDTVMENITLYAKWEPNPPSGGWSWYPGQLQFSQPSYLIVEDAGTATITVERINGSDGTVSVHYATNDGTAKDGEDYTATTGEIAFGYGETSKTFTIPVIDDAEYRGDRTAILTLSSPTGGATLGTVTTANLTISDNELPHAGKLQFNTGTYTVKENDAGINIIVSRTDGSDGTVTIHYATSDETAKAGTDYVTISGELTFFQGEIAKTIPISLLDDSSYTGDRVAVVSLSNPTGGATLGEMSQARVSIVDNDSPINVKSVQINKSKLSARSGGNSVKLVAKITPENASNKKVLWKSNKPSVAEVDENGVVTPISPGTAIITVTTQDGKKKAQCKVTVTGIAVKYVKLNKNRLNLSVKDAPVTLSASIKPRYASNHKVSWSSNKPSVATVDQNGVVTPIGSGSATIIVTTLDGRKVARCTVRVK
ncbi:leucine-rich repeat protein [Heliobacillus mobilis]|uniref:Leucine-rich repeat protein n=1 Tax=Heliobacterium mobile TaxID=28064 RepID=A0A6I3SMI3_HELMO|nr:leucine-rich repeat protein [Heliobacterium mobile]MTV49986.1 leucine-rich repeat protein [Heliobacterium mobile]